VKVAPTHEAITTRSAKMQRLLDRITDYPVAKVLGVDAR
jgi:hypothetical protein